MSSERNNPDAIRYVAYQAGTILTGTVVVRCCSDRCKQHGANTHEAQKAAERYRP